MKDIFDAYKSLVLELFLTSMLLFMLLELASVGKSALSYKQNFDASNKAIEQYREVYMYDDVVLTGNDIIMMTAKYGDLCSYYFDIPEGKFAIRPICIYYPDDDYNEHIHTSTDKRKCIKGWFIDDLSKTNSITYNSSTGSTTTSGCVGGVSERAKWGVYSIEGVTEVIGASNITSSYKCTVKRYNYDKMIKGITDTELLKAYERRKSDIIGFSFKAMY